METIKLQIGTLQAMQSGQTQDLTRPVEFEGEKLAELTTFGQGRNGGPTDTRGMTETLYRTADGRLILYAEDWSHWQGEPNVYSLQEVTEDDLSVGGAYEELGREAGFGRALTLDEALKR